MKYNDLIQFNPIDEIIKFGQLDNEDYRAKLVKNFVCSQTFENYIIPQICAKLDLNASSHRGVAYRYPGLPVLLYQAVERKVVDELSDYDVRQARCPCHTSGHRYGRAFR